MVDGDADAAATDLSGFIDNDTPSVRTGNTSRYGIVRSPTSLQSWVQSVVKTVCLPQATDASQTAGFI